MISDCRVCSPRNFCPRVRSTSGIFSHFSFGKPANVIWRGRGKQAKPGMLLSKREGLAFIASCPFLLPFHPEHVLFLWWWIFPGTFSLILSWVLCLSSRQEERCCLRSWLVTESCWCPSRVELGSGKIRNCRDRPGFVDSCKSCYARGIWSWPWQQWEAIQIEGATGKFICNFSSVLLWNYRKRINAVLGFRNNNFLLA